MSVKIILLIVTNSKNKMVEAVRNKDYKKQRLTIKARMLQLEIENFFKVVFRRRGRECKILEKTLSDILDDCKYYEIPEQLKDAGFAKLSKEEEPLFNDFIEGVTMAVADKSYGMFNVELSAYADVKGYENNFLILYIVYDNNKSMYHYQGCFCDSVHETQKEHNELKNFVFRLSLVPQM